MISKVLPEGPWRTLFPRALTLIDEILAKTLYHRGNRATARDLFDIAFVVEREVEQLRRTEPFLFLSRHEAEELSPAPHCQLPTVAPLHR